MSYAVEREGVPTPQQGWQANNISPEKYAAQLVDYHNRMVADPRVIGLCVYLCDYAAKEWQSKDLEPAYADVLKRKKDLKPRSTKPFEPPVPVGAKTTVRVNIRKGAGTVHAIVRTVNAGTIVKPIAKNVAGDWLKLDDGNWIYAAYVDGAPAGLPVDGVVTPPAQTGPVRWPLDVRRVTQIYGVNEENYRKFGLAGHNGIDFGCDTGTPVKAMAAGEVVLATSDPEGYGNVIRIWHAALRCYTVYAHLSKMNVKVGDKVAVGGVIGLSGNTGNSTGAHLHFEVRLADQVGKYTGGNPGMGASTVDPMGFVAGVLRA
jgi:murein DD-endopeptidase MepM/ murein hydrolase activator NlpD